MGAARPESPLAGYRVIDLSSGIAGAYCTKLLADGGAEVVKVESPHGDPLRRWSSGAQIRPGADGALFSYLSGNKDGIVVEPDNSADVAMLTGLLAAADAAVWSAGSKVAEYETFWPAAINSAHPQLTVTAISPFGLAGPWRERAATDFTLQAWSGGIVGLGRGEQDRAPVSIGGRVGEYLAGAYACAATLASMYGQNDSGAGQLIDLSMLEAQIMGLTYYPVTYFEMLGRPWRDTRRRTIPGVAEAKDGLVDLGCGTAQQWFDLCAMVGHPEWIDEDSPLSITEQANLHAEQIYAWVSDHLVDEIRELATAFRIPNAPVANGATVASLDHFKVRGSFVVNPRDGFLQPGHPYRIQPVGCRPPGTAPRLGEHTDRYRAAGLAPRPTPTKPANPLPLSDVRILDMTTFWAGPSCTHFLAMLGAEVIHVESARRVDGTRLIAGIPPTEDLWWEKSPIFAALNTNKKGVTLDLQSVRGKELLLRLVATCDVVVENFTPRVLDGLGLDYAAMRAVQASLIMLRMPGFGLDGPWRDNPAFAYAIESAAGVSWLTGFPDRAPYEPYSIGDPNAGVHAGCALLLALIYRRRSGEGVFVEAPMVDAALAISAEQVVEHSAYGSLLERTGNRGPTAAPQNLYRTADIDEFGRLDSWVAIAVETDEQWERLACALGSPSWATDPGLRTTAGRRAAHDRVDAELSAWCEQRGSDDVVATLWDAGVPVAKVMQPHRQTELDQLAFRGFFEEVDHPVNGRARLSTMPVTSSAERGPFHLRPAPLLGQHNHQVLAELGLTATEIADLEASGVIARAPAV